MSTREAVLQDVKENGVDTLTEKDFMQQIKDLAHVLGWWTFHPFDARRSRHGWPDLVLLRGQSALFREVKKSGAHLTGDQAYVLEMMLEAGLDAGAWWPEDWDTIIEKVLR